MLTRLSAWFGTRPKTMETNDVKLPPDLPNWSIVKGLLQDLQGRLITENISDQETGWFMQTIYNTIQSERKLVGTREGHLNRLRLQIQSNVQKELDHNCLWFGMLKYLRKVSKDEKEKFLYSTLPNIIELAMGIEDSRPKAPLLISRQQHGGSRRLSRQFVCSIVACFFLCLFPERKKESSNLNIINFTTFFKHLPYPAQIAKLRCILHYFEHVIERGMEISGSIIFCRKVASPSWMLTFDELVHCDLRLCPLHIYPQGTIEDSDAGTIQVCFGNKSVGGGVLGRSLVQEEIRFSTCPELLAAMLFMENMETNEAILVSGFEQFSSYSGYGDSLEFSGHFNGSDQVQTLVTIDAASYREASASKQYEESSVLRDLNKAVIGYSRGSGADSRAMRSWEDSCGEDGTPGAVDVAADIVTSAMTDALRQAAESPVDPESCQPSCHPFQPPCSQHHLLPQSQHLSYQQCHQQQTPPLLEDFNVRSTTHLQAAQNLQQLSLSAESAAEFLNRSKDSIHCAVISSGNLQTAQSSVYSAHQSSSSPSSNVNVSVDNSFILQPLSSVHSMVESPSTASSYSAQILVHSSSSSFFQQHQLPGQPAFSEQEEKCQGFDMPSLAVDHVIHASSAGSSFSGRAFQSSDNLAAAAESGALVRDFPISQSGLAQPGSGRELTSDILGNLSKIAPPYAGVSPFGSSFNETDKHHKFPHSAGYLVISELPEKCQEHPCTGSADNITDIVKDVLAASNDSTAEAVSYSLPLKTDTGKVKCDEPVLSQGVNTLTKDKCEDIVNSIDVVLSLPALQSELERMNSGLPNSSVIVSVDSQSLSANSAGEDNIRQPLSEVLYINVENSEFPFGTWKYSRDKSVLDGRASSIDSMFLEPPFSSSPQSSLSSANISPNTSFLVPESFNLEPPNGSGDLHATADFFIQGLDGLSSQARQSSRRGSRDFYVELREFLSSSSSGSRGSGSCGPLSSTNSSWGSRSGSVSSHGTNGSTIDFPEFWSHFRRRSSQLSDATSRRSSSSKHSSDFSTDLEEISEGVQKHNHGVIEEEGCLLSLVAEFASHFVSVAVKNGVAVGAHLTSSGKHTVEEDERNRSLVDASELSSDIFDKEQMNADMEETDSIYDKRLALRMAKAKIHRPFSILGHQQEDEERELSLPSLAQQGLMDEEKSSDLSEPVSQPGSSSELPPAKTASKCVSISGPGSTPPLSYSNEASTFLRAYRFGGQPSSSHSLDSGFSSAISSVTLTSEHKINDSLSEETAVSSSMNSSVTNLQGLCSQTANVADHTLPNEAVSHINRMGSMPDTLSAETLELKNGASESTSAKQSIPFLPETMYATLESKTIYLDPESFPQSTSLLQKEEDTSEHIQHVSVSSETNAASIPLHSMLHYKSETSEMVESVEQNIKASKLKSKLPKSSSTDTSEVRKQGHKHFRRQKAEEETVTHLETQSSQKYHIVLETSKTAETRAAASKSSPYVSTHPLNGATASSKSSGIPKFRDSIKKLSCYSRSSEPSGSKSKSSQTNTSSVKVKQKAEKIRAQKESDSSPHGKVKTDKILFKPHRSRYVFSDVAAPLCDKKKKTKPVSETFAKKQNEKQTLKKQDEKKRKQRGGSSRQDPLSFTGSPKFIRFVNSIAEMAVSQAVLEGAEILVQRSGHHGEISDELYNWFATKIVTEVFHYIMNELDMQQSSQNADISQSQENSELDSTCVSESQQSHVASRRERGRAKAAVPKPKSILPTKSDAQASSSKGVGQLRLSSSLKMVKFKDSHEEEDSSLALSRLQTHVATSIPSKTNAIPTFHRQSSSIPVPIRRRSSLDLPLSSLSPPRAHVASLSSSKLPLKSTSAQPSHARTSNQTSLTGKDLSIDIYQAAAVIVNQVFQAVSDSLDTQTLSPVSSGQHGTLSLSDTAVHSTGSRIHSNNDSIASNIFSSSSAKAPESPKRACRSVSPSIGVFSRKPMSRETLTNAFLKVDSTPSIKYYERRSSEPCQTSVLLSLQAFNSNKFSKQAVEDKQKKISRTDDDIGRGKTWRRSSLDGFSFERRHSCGFKDPVLSRFAEELMKADTSVPELVIVGSHASSSSTGSRQSSICAYKENAPANLDSELNTSFTSVCSLLVSHSSRSQNRRPYLDRSRSRESRNWKSDSSDTEYWFPPPRIVGDEFQQEYNRQHSQEELQDYASFFAGRVVQEAVCVLKCDPAYMSKEEQDVELFAENLMDQIMRDAMIASLHADSVSIHRESGDSSHTRSSALHMGSMVNSDSGDAKQALFYVGGTRPKTSNTSVRTRSKTKTMPQRRDMRSRNDELDYQRTDDNSYTSRHSGSQRGRRASAAGGHESLLSQSQQHLSVRSRPPATDLKGSRQDSFFRQSVHKNTADLLQPPSRLKRHSTPGFFPPPASLLPTLSSSAKPPSTIHHFHSGTSQCECHLQEKGTVRARNKVESASCAASSIPVYTGSLSAESSQLTKLTRTQREESCASSASSASSYHSDQTGSSLPSSSGSESIGPTGKDTPPRKHRGKRELECRSRASREADSTKLSSAHKERSRRRDSYVRRADVTNSKRRSGRDRVLHAESRMEQCPTIDEFAASLSRAVIENALLCCRDNRWIRFLSYNMPIATGNWGCGAYRGNAQLKLVIQWIAASVGHAPSLMYYTFNDRRLTQAQEIADLISGQTVGHLAAALREYCNWVSLNLTSLSPSSFSSSARSQFRHQSTQHSRTSHSAWKDEQDSYLPQTLFDFLLEKFQRQGDR